MRCARPEALEEALSVAQKPFVLVEHGQRGTRITALNEHAAQAGACPGQMLTDARAACPSLVVDQANREADKATLERLAGWCLQFSPIITCDQSAVADDVIADFGLLLDTTGCDHLFGGEDGMIVEISNRLEKTGFCARLALAPTPGAAHALARYGENATIARTDKEAVCLMAGLPVEALRLETGRTILLRRLGLKTVHSVARVPRQALERRFRSRRDAQSVLMRLDQLSGAIREPLSPVTPAASWRTYRPCPEPVLDTTAVRFALDDLLMRLTGQMEAAAKGARGWRLTAFHADGGHSSVAVRLSRPSCDRAHIRHLFEDRLEVIDPGFGIDGFLLEACDTDKVALSQATLVCDTGQTQEAFAAEFSGLVDRLANRFGATNVARAAPVRSHVPERAWRAVNAGNCVSWREIEIETATRTALRPFRLFDNPEAAQVTASVPDGPPLTFRWRKQLYTVIRARGPERIAPQWWCDGPRGTAIRDYYEIEDQRGRRFWLFREGMYGAARPPGWFVHGIFG